ncbi:Calcium-activated chloride channel-like protein [Elsinoe fawcettii]|nr:Calcium-activated chloride channel-like protein [Elsinoe fawcettii]
MASSPTRTKVSDQGNMSVDYVISYRFATTDKQKAIAQFEKLVEKLSSVGLSTEVRNGDASSVLVFVRVASEEYMFGEVYRSRVNDWIHGIRAAAPEKETRKSLEAEPLHEGERLRIIHRLITLPESEGGAGITAKQGEWKNVESIFALHDHAYNKAWIKRWSTKYLLDAQDIDEIRDRLGENIAFYFAFTQSYFQFLLVPAAIGGSTWFLLGGFSPVYAIASTLWTIVFVEYWKHQEYDLAVKWGVKGVSKIQTKRKEYKHEKEMTDPVTGETVRIFPATKRLQRQLLQLPFAIAAAAVLGSLIATAFAIEIFISEVYSGPLKSILVFLPTGILTTGLPVLTGIFTTMATRLTEFENYETDAAHETAMTQKIFILNFITSYLGIFLTAFVYVPFGSLIVPYLDIFSVTVSAFADNDKQLQTPSSSKFHINPDRLRKQVIYFTVTAQLVNLGMEVIVPYLKRKGFMKYKEMQTSRAAKNGGSTPDPSENDHPEEQVFLARVRQESELDTYNVTDDLREMVLQFGYLSLFSVVWPLTGISFLINDWVELRADAVKICIEMQRPTPSRRDTIGPWLDSLGFLSWIGAVTSSALVYMFSGEKGGPDGRPDMIKGWGLLLTILLSEHAYLLVRWAVQVGISKLDSPGRQKERKDRYMVRKTYFEESLSEIQRIPKMADAGEKITRESLEEDARRGSLKSATAEDRFWARQRSWKETAQIGSRLINAAVSTEDKKTQ